MHITCHFDADDEVTFHLVDQPGMAEPFIDLAIGRSHFYLREDKLSALLAAIGEARAELRDAVYARPPKLTADEDGHSLAADQHDREVDAA